MKKEREERTFKIFGANRIKFLIVFSLQKKNFEKNDSQ